MPFLNILAFSRIEKMNAGLAWYQVNPYHPNIMREIDNKIVEIATLLPELFRIIPQDDSVLRFADALSRMNTSAKKVTLDTDDDLMYQSSCWDYRRRYKSFGLAEPGLEGLCTLQAEIYERNPQYRKPIFVEPFQMDDLFVSKACYLLVSRSHNVDIQPAITQLANLFETLIRSAMRFCPSSVHPELSARPVTARKPCHSCSCSCHDVI